MNRRNIPLLVCLVLFSPWGVIACSDKGASDQHRDTKTETPDVFSPHPNDAAIFPSDVEENGPLTELISPPDLSQAVPGELAFRLETRFGTTRQWKGVVVLDPQGLVHFENDRGDVCRKYTENRYVEELVQALEEANWTQWPADQTNSEDGACPVDTFLMVFRVQWPGSLDSREFRFCENRASQLQGAPRVFQVISKISGDAQQNGTCGLAPLLLGRPTASASIGYDDQVNHVLGVARFQQPDFCLVVYANYHTDVYQTTRILEIDSQYTSSLLGVYLSAHEDDPFFSPIKQFCTGMEGVLIQNAEFVSDLDPPAAVFLVRQEEGRTTVWLGVGGVLAVQPFVSAGDDIPESRPMVFNLNNVEFQPLDSFPGGSASLSWTPWRFLWLESTLFESESMGVP